MSGAIGIVRAILLLPCSAQYQLCLSLVVDGALLTETGQSRVVWTHSTQGEEEEEGSKQPAAKRAKTEGGEEVEMVLGVRVEMVTSPLRRLRLPPGGYACLVAWVTLPEAMECKQRRGIYMYVVQHCLYLSLYTCI